MNTHHEQDIDRILNALRQTDPPTGLEARIASRVRQAETARTKRPSSFTATLAAFAVILNGVKHPRILLGSPTRYALATVAVLTLSLTVIHPSHKTSVSSTATHPVLLSEAVESHPIAQPKDPDAIPRTKTARTLSATNPPLCDCDPSALAETLAPSHPAPPMPLTPQERLLILATRPGSPIEVAELDQLREPLLRAAAEAQEHAQLRQVMQGLLRPLAIAQSLNATNPTEAPAENTQPAPEPTPSN